MKRSGFKRVPVKRIERIRTPIKRKRRKKTPEQKLRDELWILCKLIIRKKYGNTCYTCNATGLEGSNWHTGHFIASAVCGAYLRYDLRNLRPQCLHCNISLSGNAAVFGNVLAEREGKAYVAKIFRDKNMVIKADRIWLQGMVDKYHHILDTLV